MLAAGPDSVAPLKRAVGPHPHAPDAYAERATGGGGGGTLRRHSEDGGRGSFSHVVSSRGGAAGGAPLPLPAPRSLKGNSQPAYLRQSDEAGSAVMVLDQWQPGARGALSGGPAAMHATPGAASQSSRAGAEPGLGGAAAVGRGMAGDDEVTHAALAEELAGIGSFARDTAAAAAATYSGAFAGFGSGGGGGGRGGGGGQRSGTHELEPCARGWYGNGGLSEDLSMGDSLQPTGYAGTDAFAAFAGIPAPSSRPCCFHALGICREGDACRYHHEELAPAPVPARVHNALAGFTEFSAATGRPEAQALRIPSFSLQVQSPASFPSFSSFGPPYSATSSLLSLDSPSWKLAGSQVASPSPPQQGLGQGLGHLPPQQGLGQGLGHLRPLSAPDSVGGFAFGAPGSVAFSNTQQGVGLSRSAYSVGSGSQGGGLLSSDAQALQRAGFGGDVNSFAGSIPFEFGETGSSSGGGYGGGVASGVCNSEQSHQGAYQHAHQGYSQEGYGAFAAPHQGFYQQH